MAKNILFDVVVMHQGLHWLGLRDLEGSIVRLEIGCDKLLAFTVLISLAISLSHRQLLSRALSLDKVSEAFILGALHNFRRY